jgi:hypothetical protein
MVTIERNVGRLVEIRDRGTTSAADLSPFARVIALARELGPDATVALIVDLRSAERRPPEQSEQLVKIIRANSGRTERAAVVVGDSPAMARQTQRMSDKVAIDAHRVVHSRDEALAWLDPVLDLPERTRLRQFLDG